MTMPYDTYYHSDYVREYTYEDFEEITFDHTDMFILNPHKREMQLRKEYSLIYSTIMIAWCVYVVSSFFAAHSMEFRRTVNYYLDSYVYETDGDNSDDSESESSDDECEEDYSPTKAGYSPTCRRGYYESESGSESGSETEEPEEASEEETEDEYSGGDTGEYDIPQPDYNESNLNERIYRLD